MTVNHGRRLQPEYFQSYLSLVMNARSCDLACVKDYMLKNFFRGDSDKYGSVSRENFTAAIKSFE